MRYTIAHPRPGTKQQISGTTTTAKATNAVGAQTSLVYVFNQGTTVAYIFFGLTGGAATAANGFPLAGGRGEYLSISPGEFVHALMASGTATIDVVEMTY